MTAKKPKIVSSQSTASTDSRGSDFDYALASTQEDKAMGVFYLEKNKTAERLTVKFRLDKAGQTVWKGLPAEINALIQESASQTEQK